MGQETAEFNQLKLSGHLKSTAGIVSEEQDFKQMIGSSSTCGGSNLSQVSVDEIPTQKSGSQVDHGMEAGDNQHVGDGPKGLHCALNKSTVPRLFASAVKKQTNPQKLLFDTNMTGVKELDQRQNLEPVNR